MAVLSPGAFSIREYAAQMRDADVARSWPFDGEPELPPMVVEKFRLWSDEVEKIRIVRSKGKSKGPKKRSIADIFAVAPLVEREDIDDDYVDDDEEGGNSRVLALCDVEIDENNRKEKPHEAKSAHGILKSSVCEGLVANTSYVVPTLKKKRTKFKYSPSEKKKRPVEASKLIKHRESDFNILKNCTKGVLEDRRLQGDHQDKSSDTDKTTGSGREAFPSLEYDKFHNFVVPSSYAKDHSVDRGKNLATNEISDSDESPQCESEDIPNLLSPDIGFERYLSDRLMAGNRVVPRSEYLSAYAASSSMLPTLKKEAYYRNNDNADLSRAATTSFTEYINAFSRPSLPSVVTYANQAQQYEPFPPLSPLEFLRSITPFSDLKQRAVSGDVRYTDQGFWGLPLNSQGELIQLNSNASDKGMFGFSTSLPVHNLQTSSTIDFSRFEGNNYCGGSKLDSTFKSPPIHDFVRENSEIGKEGNYFDFFRENSHAYHQHSNLDLMHRTQNGQNHYNHGKTSDHVPLNVSQPTMRLMGKEFPVGKGNDDSQSSEDGNIWTDKRIIAEHRAAASSAIDKKIENTPLFANKTQSSQSFLQMNVDSSMLPYPNYPQSNPLISRNHSSQLHPYIRSNFSPPFTNQNLSPQDLQEPFLYRYVYDSTPQVGRNPIITDRPAFEFPFLPPVCGENLNLNLSSSSSLPPWLLSEKQRTETPPTSYPSYFARPAVNPESTRTSFMNNIHGYRMIKLDKGKATRKRRANELNESATRTKMLRPCTDSPMKEKISCVDRGVSLLGPGKHVLKQSLNVNGNHSRSTNFNQDSPIFWF